MTDHRNKKLEALVVAAVDFGTTYSGWAFALRHSFQENHIGIQTHSGWKTGDGLVTQKTPTCILFDPDDNFHSFGYDAEDKYTELLDEEKADGWKYLRRFKMDLYNSETQAFKTNLKRKKLIDAQGHKMSALKVFSESIKFLKESFMRVVTDQVRFVKLEDIHWVLTVPAIWTEQAKQFMRMAATQAGIPGELLTLAYEPEAAAVFCKDLYLRKKSDKQGEKLSSLEPGEQFLVLDCGGGTIDITSYELLEKGKIKELRAPSGGPWGGTTVDDNFMQYMENLFGEDVWEAFKENNSVDIRDLQRMFETKKQVIGEGKTDITMVIPPTIFDTYKEVKEVAFEPPDGVTKLRGKLKFPVKELQHLFKKPLDYIVCHVRYLLKLPSMKKISTILVVGGFSDCVLLRERIKKEFSDHVVIHPEDAVVAILKGAVMFGFIPELIKERVCPLTYGIAVNIPFIDGVHPKRCKQEYDGRYMCTDVFKVLARAGEKIIIGQSSFDCVCLPTHRSDTTAVVELYQTSDENPKYTLSEYNVEKMGTLLLDIPDVERGKCRPISIKLEFDITELTVTALEVGTCNEVSRKFDYLI